MARGGKIKTKADYEMKADILATSRKLVAKTRTPSRVQARLATESLLDSVVVIAGMLKELPSVVPGLGNLAMAESESSPDTATHAYHVEIEKVLALIVGQLEDISRGCQSSLHCISQVGHSTKEGSRIIEMGLEGLRAELDQLQGAIGDRSTNLLPSEPSLWGATQGLGSRLDDVEQVTHALNAKIDNLRSFADDMAQKARFSGPDDTSTITGGTGLETFSADTVIRDFAPNLGPDERFVTRDGVLHSGQRTSGVNVFGASAGGNDGFGGNGGGGGGYDPRLSSAATTTSSKKTQNFSKLLEPVIARLEKLEKKQTTGIGDTIFFGDHFFGGSGDALAFLEKHLGTNTNFRFGALVSPYQVLSMMHSQLTGKKLELSELANLKKLGLGRIELQAFLAATVEIPELFTANSKFSGHPYKSSASVLSNARF
jgi:hypothetical protein